MSLPWVPGAVRAVLMADVGFSALCQGRCGTRLPTDMTKPFARIRTAGGISLSGDGVAWSPLVQIEGWASDGGATDPETVVWDIAADAGRVLGKARNITYKTMQYSVRILDGPLPDVDTSRGTGSPLYWAALRVELKAQTT